jgi:hypothetical protein
MLRRFFQRRPSPHRRGGSSLRLGLERLEDRTVPTTSAVLSNGVLTLTGDANANDITITEQPTSGSYLVAAADLAGTPVSFNGVSSIAADLGAGADSFTFNGDASVGSQLSGTLSVKGAGSLTIDLNARVNIGGQVTVNHSETDVLDLGITGEGTTIGRLLVFDGDGDSTLRMDDYAHVLGFVSLNQEGGNNSAIISNARIDSFFSFVGTTGNDILSLGGGNGGARIGQNVFLAAGAGTNQFTMSETTIAGTVNFATAGSGETFLVQGLSVIHGPVIVNKTGGSQQLSATVSVSNIDGDFVINGGESDEVVSVNGRSIIGNLTTDLKAGSNSVTIDGYCTIGNFLHYGTGNEVIKIQPESRVRGYVSINASSAADLDVFVYGSLLQSFLSVVSGAGADSVNVIAGETDGNLAFVLGDGNDHLNLLSLNAFGSLKIAAQGGDDIVDLERGPGGQGSVIYRAFTFLGGDGADRLSIGTGAFSEDVRFLGAATIDGGGNTATVGAVDVLYLYNARFVGPKPSFTDVVLSPSRVYAVTDANVLISFEAIDPSVTLSTIAITGVQIGEQVVGIDFRPATGQLFGLGSSGRIYTIDIGLGIATQANMVTITGNDVDFGFDFDPVADALRIVSDGNTNLRATAGGSGTVAIDSNVQFAAGDVNAASNPNIVAAAYSNNFDGSTTTTLYGIDSNLDILVRQDPPNAGTLTTIGSLGVDAGSLAGFDITEGNVAYAVLNVGGASRLYLVNLGTGSARLVGDTPAGLTIRGIAVGLPREL